MTTATTRLTFLPTSFVPKIFATFEGEDYGDWKVEGEAFGSRPARGTLAGQQKVSGFQGP